MPRPKKDRQVCHFPQTLSFVPAGDAPQKDPVVMSVEEYETIRLIDKLGFSQEQCCTFMKVARTTVQQIYADARKKLAQMLIEGRPLTITGGNYAVCPNTEGCHNKKGCQYEGCCHMK